MALLVQAVGRRLRWPGKTITWSPVGGVFRAQGLILEPLKESLAEDPKKSFELVPPKFPRGWCRAFGPGTGRRRR